MKFRDLEVEFNIFDADDAEVYELAIKKVQDGAKKEPNETLSGAIRRQCNNVFTFFDDLFGEDFHKDIFGETTNLLECVSAFSDFVKGIDEQKKELDALTSEIANIKTDSVVNRAARRAVVQPAKQ